MRNKDEIAAEIEKLTAMKPNVRRSSAFGDDNRTAVQAQIDVLNDNMTNAQIYDRYEDGSSELESAIQARMWIDGDGMDESLSEDWLPLCS